LKPDGYVRLKNAYIIHCDEVVQDENGEVVELKCSYIPESRSANDTSGIKVKGTIQWVDGATGVDAEIRRYGVLLKDAEYPGQDFGERMNLDSEHIFYGKAEPYLASVADDTAFQQPWCDGRTGPLYECYPEYDFGALGAWAWGYRCAIDALAQMDYVDMSCIAVTGHSRGGKTALLAGALDERIAIVNPVQTCAGGGACYRVHMAGIPEGGVEGPGETLADIWRNLGFWFGPRLGDYAKREEELPFDSHMLKAMVAPRRLLISEAAGDMWANPLGSYQTSVAAREVWKLHGCPENIQWYWRPGVHSHAYEDLTMLLSVIRNMRTGAPLHENMGRILFEAPAPIWDWACPQAE
jgi:hypothetical protein